MRSTWSRPWPGEASCPCRRSGRWRRSSGRGTRIRSFGVCSRPSHPAPDRTASDPARAGRRAERGAGAASTSRSRRQAGRVEPAALAWIAELVRESTVLASDPTAPSVRACPECQAHRDGTVRAGSRGPLKSARIRRRRRTCSSRPSKDSRDTAGRRSPLHPAFGVPRGHSRRPGRGRVSSARAQGVDSLTAFGDRRRDADPVGDPPGPPCTPPPEPGRFHPFPGRSVADPGDDECPGRRREALSPGPEPGGQCGTRPSGRAGESASTATA